MGVPDDRPPMNIANLFVRASRRRADGPAVALGTDVLLTHDALVTPRGRDRRGAAPALRPGAGRSRGPGHEQRPRLPRAAARRLACRAHHGAGQCQAAPSRARLHPGPCRRQGVLRDAGSGRDRGAARGRASLIGAGRRGRQPRPSDAARGRADRACRSAPGRRRLAVLHQRHDWPSQGRHADPSQPFGDDPGLSRGCRPHRARAMRSSMPHRCHTARGFMSCHMRRAAPASCCRPAAASIPPRFFRSSRRGVAPEIPDRAV